MSMARTRRKTQRSAVWEHFTRFTADNGIDKALCKRCHVVLRAGTENGTTSLLRHTKKCKAQEDYRGAPMRAAPPSSGGSSSECGDDDDPNMKEEEVAAASKDLARMIAIHGHDPSIVEDDYFKSFVHRLNPGFKVPTRVAIEQMCDAFVGNRWELTYMPDLSPAGRLSLAVGKTRVIEGEVLYMACHFIDYQWKLQKVVTEAYMVVPSRLYHGPLSGVMELADLEHPVLYKESVEDILFGVLSHGIDEDMFMMAWMVTDDYIRDELRDHIEEEFSRTYAAKRKLICTTYMDHVFHSIAGCLLLDPEFNRRVCFEVQGLDLTRKTRQQLLSRLGLDHLWAYNQHWYSCYCSLKVLHTEGLGISKFTQLLCRIWEEIDRSIQRIYSPSCPTSNLCLVELFRVREILQAELAHAVRDEDNTTNQRNNAFQGGDHAFYNGLNGFQGGKAVVDVVRDARDTLDRAIQGSYLVWSIPLILDPRYKFKFIEFSFNRAFGLEVAADYISKVERKIDEMYKDYAQEDGGAVAEDVGGADLLQQAWDEHCRSQLQDCNNTTQLEHNLRELDRYLRDPVVMPTQGFDILKWWKEKVQKYPTMARMARDALTMPACNMLSSEQLAHVRSIVRGYSTESYRHFR